MIVEISPLVDALQHKGNRTTHEEGVPLLPQQVVTLDENVLLLEAGELQPRVLTDW